MLFKTKDVGCSRPGLTIVCLALVAVFGAWGCSAQADIPIRTGVAGDGDYADAIEVSRAALLEIAADGPALSVAVALNGSVVWSEALGYADIEARAAAEPSTLFRLYSLAKPMTAVASARLLERGRMAPDADVREFVPEFPDKGAPISVMDLAAHTSGIRHYRDDDEARSQRHCDDVWSALEIFADDPLVHPPGQGQTYSSWGYVLFSAVLERANGEAYDQSMTSLLFEPAGMRSMRIDDPTSDVPGRARFYQELEPGSFTEAEPVDNTCKWGAGGWVGTAEDVARFSAAMIDGSLISERTQQLLLRGESIYRAQGVSAGGTGVLIADAESGLGIALLGNAVGETFGPSLIAAVADIHAAFREARDRLPADPIQEGGDIE